MRREVRWIASVLGGAFGLAVVHWLLPGTGAGPVLTGRPAIVDGDTLRLERERVRLKGMDAPELSQTCTSGSGANWPCGQAARAALVQLVDGRPVSCQGAGRDRYGRVLATCRVGDLDLGAAVVSQGLAVAYGGYTAEERQAKAARVGLWAGSFEQPAEWRRDHESGGGDGLLEALGQWFVQLTGEN